MTRPSSLAGAVALAIAVHALALSAAPGFWQVASQAALLRGQVDQLSIDEHGRLTLGPAIERVFDGAVPVVWSMTQAANGTVFLGTGNEGKVFKVGADGRGELFHDSSELAVHSLAPAPDGGLYIGTSPDGRVYRLTAAGASTPLFDPEDKYVWALTTDHRGTLYAATGDQGLVYRIRPDGTGERLFDTRAGHAMTLRVQPDGHLLVGTGLPGRVFRVDETGRGFLLLDTPFQEVRSLAVGPDGVIYAAALNGRRGGADAAPATEPAPVPPPPATPMVSAEVTAFTVIDTTTAAGAAPPTAGTSAGSAAVGAIYRIQPDGLWDLIWESRDDSPYDLVVESGGSLLVATGPSGKLLRLAGNPVQSTLLARVPAQHATSLTVAGGRTLLATANPGLLMAMSASRATRGTYESEVNDARLVSRWGVLSWRATVPPGTAVEISTRSGNTRTPDEAWSDWSAPYTSAAGSPIASPSARYLQWRAVLSGGRTTPVLTSVSLAYLPRNVRPRVESITVHPPGVVFQKPFSTGEAEIAGFDEDPDERRLAAPAGQPPATAPALGRRIQQRGLQTLQWKADDENGDELTYDVLYRREGETTWRPLRSGLRDTLTVWDTTSVPNGTYVVKIVASDGRSNPPALALAGELESTSFDIDNTPPMVVIGPVRREGSGFAVSVEVSDADSPLRRVEYSLDAQRWQALFPDDGILDSRREAFSVGLEAAAAGRVLVVRATDSLGNVAAAEAPVPAPR